METANQRQRGINVLELTLILGSFVVSFRAIALTVLALALIHAALRGRRSRVVIALFAAYALLIFSPVDLPLYARYRGGGHHAQGLRLVRCVVGMPASTDLIAHFGEYYSVGCSGFSVFSPRWILVLD